MDDHTPLMQLRLHKLENQNIGRDEHRIAAAAPSFVLDRAAGEFARRMAERHPDLVDELAPFAIAPFDEMTLSADYAGTVGNTIESLHIWKDGRYRLILLDRSINARPTVIPGWIEVDEHGLRNDTLFKYRDAEAALERLKVDHRVLQAIFLLLARPGGVTVTDGGIGCSRFVKGRNRWFHASSTVKLSLSTPEDLRRLYVTGNGKTPAMHQVRRHWYHRGGDRAHAHDWVREEGDKLRFRCLDHRRRNPCAIEGCKRTQRIHARGLGKSLDAWICADHWRALIPPGSPERRIYLRFFRRARRHGWSDESVEAFWRVWNRIVSRARARAGGDLERSVAREMGW